MKTRRFIASCLIAQLLMTSTARLWADEPSFAPGNQETPASARLMKPLLRKVAATGAFDTEDGKAKLFEAIEKGLARGRELALANLDRLSDSEIRAQVRKTRERALKDGNSSAVQNLDGLLASPDGVLRLKLRALHSPEKEQQFLQRIKDKVASSGSVRQAVEDLDGCWDYVPLITDNVLILAIVFGYLCTLLPVGLLFIPAFLIALALVPVALVIDYVVIFPFYFFIDILPCETGH
jgi:hypothetical protein